MALVGRVAAVLPLIGALTTAAALTGAAVFTVAQAGCSDPGHYVKRDGVVELVGGCLDHRDLPPAPRKVEQAGGVLGP
ncbi:hypothetical protein F0L68_10490 [Solihabitans fulvus]|uniref:Secreted protein n=1 Tax=Solihabitans fulvus TaxID=1892852 RepID=A0A5B2XJU0_9PSEU|nr:hypothetical protein [Solihabitans fulvus]KAA2263239.1 hypothetical protein F0L68_10490 [Solihabitans fulvus]